MYLNGREVKFAYTAGAYLDYQEWLISKDKVSEALADVQLAIFMHRAYLKMEGIKDIKPLAVDELVNLKYWQLKELIDESQLAKKADSTQTVEVEEKNGKSAEKAL